MPANSALAPVQAMLFTLLSTDPTLIALAKVYDHVPEKTPMPYVVLAGLTERPDDTQGARARMMTVTIEAYSQANGFKEIESIVDAVVALMDSDSIPAAPPWDPWSCVYANGNIQRESDGITRSASLTFDLGVSL